MRIPKTIFQGDEFSFSENPFVDSQGREISSAEWNLVFIVKGNGNTLTITNTTDFTINVTSEQTKEFKTGKAYFQISAQNKANSLRVTIERGEFEVFADLAYQAADYDPRTQDEKDLETIKKLISSLIGQHGGVVEYRIGTRSLKRYELNDLLVLKSQLEFKVKTQQRKDNGELNRPGGVWVRFK